MNKIDLDAILLRYNPGTHSTTILIIQRIGG